MSKFLSSPLLCSLSLLLFCVTTHAQEGEWDAECVLESQNCGLWTTVIDEPLQLLSPDCFAYVSYKYRTCTTNGLTFVEVVVTGWTGTVGCTGFYEKSYFHQNYNGQKEYVILGLLTVKFSNQLQDCPDSKNLANVYTAACGIWVCCEYNVTPADPVCDQGYALPYPHYGTPRKVRACKWQPCGTVCCRRVYELCKNELGQVSVTLVSKARLGDCSLQNQYGAKPCEDGC